MKYTPQEKVEQQYGMERYFVVNTIDDEASAKNAEVVRFVNTIEYEASAKNALVRVFMETQELPATDANNPNLTR